MVHFENIWTQFDYVIGEMRDGGMCFFEGFILSVSDEKIDEGIQTLCSAPYDATLNLSTWFNDSTKEGLEKIYTTEQYLALFRAGKISTLQSEYEPIQNQIKLHLKLMIEKWGDKTIAEIICYREPILSNHNQKLAVEAAVLEFLRLKQLFGGSSLFIGPDTLNYPEDDHIYPKEWIKIA